MINIDLIQVAILWGIVGVCFICAINARGFFRQLLSWLVVFTMATMAALFSYLEYESLKRDMGLSENRASVQQSAFVLDSNPKTDSANLSITDDSVGSHYSAVEKVLLENAIAISDSILSFPKWNDVLSHGIERRENFESKALFLRNKSMNFYRQIRNLPTPSGEKKQSYDLLLVAADNLRLAGYEIHYQFSLEADTLGESVNKARRHANQARTIFSTMRSEE